MRSVVVVVVVTRPARRVSSHVAPSRAATLAPVRRVSTLSLRPTTSPLHNSDVARSSTELGWHGDGSPMRCVRGLRTPARLPVLPRCRRLAQNQFPRGPTGQSGGTTRTRTHPVCTVRPLSPPPARRGSLACAGKPETVSVKSGPPIDSKQPRADRPTSPHHADPPPPVACIHGTNATEPPLPARPLSFNPCTRRTRSTPLRLLLRDTDASLPFVREPHCSPLSSADTPRTPFAIAAIRDTGDAGRSGNSGAGTLDARLDRGLVINPRQHCFDVCAGFRGDFGYSRGVDTLAEWSKLDGEFWEIDILTDHRSLCGIHISRNSTEGKESKQKFI